MNNTKAFTLIELLVVVLIIGILAAVALPQYQKAVQKSRNTQLKQIVKAIAQAEQTYYMANGKYAANFDELAIDLPLTPVATTPGGNTGACATSIMGTDSARTGKDFYVALNSSDTNMSRVGAVAYWNQGTYACTGFAIILGTDQESLGLHCREFKNISLPQGSFCKKIEQATPSNITNDYWQQYVLPQ